MSPTNHQIPPLVISSNSGSTIQAFAAEHGIELMAVHTGELKRWATGKGNAGKPAMMEAAKARGWDPADDNEADAALLLEYAADMLTDGRLKASA